MDNVSESQTDVDIFPAYPADMLSIKPSKKKKKRKKKMGRRVLV